MAKALVLFSQVEGNPEGILDIQCAEAAHGMAWAGKGSVLLGWGPAMGSHSSPSTPRRNPDFNRCVLLLSPFISLHPLKPQCTVTH